MNFVSITGILVFLSGFLTFLSVYKSGLKFSKINIIWFLFNFFVSLWGLALFLATSSSFIKFSFIFAWIQSAVAIPIPILFFHFLYEYFNLKKYKKWVLTFFYSLAVIYVGLIVFYRLEFVHSVSWRFDSFYYGNAGDLYGLFAFYYGILSLFGLKILLNNYKKVSDKESFQIKLLFGGFCVGFVGGGTTFPLMYGYQLYPFGTLGVLIYLVLTGVVLLRLGFLDIRIYLPRLFSHGLVGLIIIFTVQAVFLLQLNHTVLNLIILVEVLLWAKYGAYLLRIINLKQEKYWIKDWYDPAKLITSLSNSLTPTLNLIDVIKVVQAALKEHIKIRNVYSFIAIKDPENNKTIRHYKLIADDTTKPIIIPASSFIIRSLPQVYKNNILQQNLSQKMCEELKKKNIVETKMILPICSIEHLEGFIAIGEKESEISYTAEDIDILNWIINQAYLIWHRIDPYEDIKYQNVLSMERAKEASNYKNLAEMSKQIAHEINNPMGVINSSAHILIRKIQAGNPDLEFLERRIRSIAEEAKQVSKTASAIMKYNFTKSDYKHEVDTDDVIRKILEFPVDSTITVETDLLQPSPNVWGEPIRLRMAFFNVFKNAMDVLKDRGGTIRFSSMVETIPIKTKSVKVLKISISDDGPGMSEEVLARLYDPFFTTKPEGHGLGLITVKQIIEDHNGLIEIESIEGTGTTFHMYLPVHEKPEKP